MGLIDDPLKDIHGALEIGHERLGSSRGFGAHPHQRAAGVYGHHLGIFERRFGDLDELRSEGQHLAFGLVSSSPDPGTDGVAVATHRTGSIPKPGAASQAHGFHQPDRLRQLHHALGQQPGVARVGDVRRDDRGIGSDLVEFHHMSIRRLLQKGHVELVDHLRTAAGGDLHERGGVRHGVGDADAAEAPPGQGIGDLCTEGLEAEPVSETQEHHPQVRFHRDRGPADHRVEE